MLFNHFSRKEVKDIIRKVKRNYEEQLSAARARTNELIAQNRVLAARLSELEGDKSEISDALLKSIDAGRQLEEKSLAYVENQMRGIRLIADKSRRLVAELKAKYPDEDDCAELEEFFSRMDDIFSDSAEGGFAYESGEPVTDDLESICRELGIEDDGKENEREFVFFEDDED